MSRLPFSALLATALPVSVALAAETTPNIEVTATLQGDYVQDFKRVDGNWDDTLRPSRIPTTDGEFGDGHLALVVGHRPGRLIGIGFDLVVRQVVGITFDGLEVVGLALVHDASAAALMLARVSAIPACVRSTTVSR